MNNLTQGDPDVVTLTRAEFEALDGAIASENAIFDTALEDRAELTINANDMKAILRGEIHPLTAWRKAAGLTQGQLAERANTRAATISDIEGNRIDPRLSTLSAISGALGVNLDDIVS